ncbi:hypothetical protein [Azospirillum sp. TSO22-1]|uniref:hypothetical protein n=1 Tax=Azospirillum sp. TSO22-1 TaxID=716789 RepID=UPI000D615DFB|nr:hypothetical protein [Azospirillum sp. TSO22-1]PWC52765.1 hypothetical protein TSO221_12740 [Azospirillum sp. TSO22-1]
MGNEEISGMRRAAAIASVCSVAFVEEMTPRQAAQAMRDIIVETITAHAEALRKSEYEREQPPISYLANAEEDPDGMDGPDPLVTDEG